jgi:hypothetical protein
MPPVRGSGLIRPLPAAPSSAISSRTFGWAAGILILYLAYFSSSPSEGVGLSAMSATRSVGGGGSALGGHVSALLQHLTSFSSAGSRGGRGGAGGPVVAVVLDRPLAAPAPASAAAGSPAPATRPRKLLVVGAGEMLGSAVARSALRENAAAATSAAAAAGTAAHDGGAPAPWSVFGWEDFSRGFVPLVPADEGVVFVESGFDDNGAARVFAAADVDGVGGFDAVVLGFDAFDPVRARDVVRALWSRGVDPIGASSLPPTLVVPNLLLRPVGAQGLTGPPSGGFFAADDAHDAQVVLRDLLAEAIGGLGAAGASAGPECSLTGAVCFAGEGSAAATPSASHSHSPSSTRARASTNVLLVDVGSTPVYGPGLQLRPDATHASSCGGREVGTCMPGVGGEGGGGGSSSQALFALATCLDAQARAVAKPESYTFDFGALLTSFESALGGPAAADAETGAGDGDGPSPLSVLGRWAGATTSSPAGPFQGGPCSAALSATLALASEERGGDARRGAFHADAVGDALLAAAKAQVALTFAPGAAPTPPLALLARAVGVDVGGRGLTLVSSQSTPHGVSVEDTGLLPPPLWLVDTVFSLPNVSAAAVAPLARLRSAVAAALPTHPELAGLVEAAWWSFRHGALGGYREPFPTTGDFGGAWRAGGDGDTAAEGGGGGGDGDGPIRVGSASSSGTRYSLRDIYFFGITHHALHPKAAASQASYCWRLRRGGVLWYSTRSDPVLPVVAVSHPFGDHYGTLFLRVARVWQRVHPHTANSYPWYVRLWDDNYAVAEGYVAAANTADADALVGLGRVGEYARRDGSWFNFLGGGACALMSNAVIRVQDRILPSCLRAAELWYANADPGSAGFDPVMPECAPGRYGCEDVVFAYCLLKELGPSFKQVSAQGFNHVNGETLSERGLFECRGLACRRRVRSPDNGGAPHRIVVLHWVKTGMAMMRYDGELYGTDRGVYGAMGDSRDAGHCDLAAIDPTCEREFG